jgi:hypothetical protein
VRHLDGSLSRRAQTMLGDPSALVYVGSSAGRRDPTRPADDQPRDQPGGYVLERAGHEPVSLGDSGGLAYTALVALRAAQRAAPSEQPAG